jgi:hypothetical protein
MEAKIIVPDIEGLHNKDYEKTQKRLVKAGTYKDLSTVIICPTRGVIPATVVQSWLNLMKPMNQRVIGPIFIEGMEVGAAYTHVIDMILANPELAKYKYILCIEEDNLPPPDGLLKLYESIEGQVDGNVYDGVGALYWTKGEAGQPMCYGNPGDFPKNFIPFMPPPESVQPCNGLGQGFTLFRMEMFKDERFPKPLFETRQRYTPGVGAEAYTQDLKFAENAGKLGYKFACDSRVRVGHRDVNTGIVW